MYDITISLSRLFWPPGLDWPPGMQQLFEPAPSIIDKRELMNEDYDTGHPDTPYEAGLTQADLFKSIMSIIPLEPPFLYQKSSPSSSLGADPPWSPSFPFTPLHGRKPSPDTSPPEIQMECCFAFTSDFPKKKKRQFSKEGLY